MTAVSATNNLRHPPATTAGVVAVVQSRYSATPATAATTDTPTVRADDLGSMLWGFRTELNNSRLAVASIAVEGLTRLLRRILL